MSGMAIYLWIEISPDVTEKDMLSNRTGIIFYQLQEPQDQQHEKFKN